MENLVLSHFSNTRQGSLSDQIEHLGRLSQLMSNCAKTTSDLIGEEIEQDTNRLEEIMTTCSSIAELSKLEIMELYTIHQQQPKKQRVGFKKY